MDPYRTLGVSRDATEAEIKKAYRRLVKEVHPDSGSPGDVERFRSIQTAYEMISTPEGRRAHEAREHAGTSVPVSWTGGFQEPIRPFQEVRPFRRRAAPVHFDIVLSSDEARHGGEVVLETARERECPRCSGRGLGFFGWCGECLGEGWLRGYERVVFRIPAGVRHGDIVTATGSRLRGQVRVR